MNPWGTEFRRKRGREIEKKKKLIRMPADEKDGSRTIASISEGLTYDSTGQTRKGLGGFPFMA